MHNKFKGDKNEKEIMFKWLFVVLIIFAAITYFGCEQKNDKAEHPQNDKVTADTTSTAVKSEEPKDTIVVTKITIPDLKGTWVGIFDGRSSTLKITEQIDSSFSGKNHNQLQTGYESGGERYFKYQNW